MYESESVRRSYRRSHWHCIGSSNGTHLSTCWLRWHTYARALCNSTVGPIEPICIKLYVRNVLLIEHCHASSKYSIIGTLVFSRNVHNRKETHNNIVSEIGILSWMLRICAASGGGYNGDNSHHRKKKQLSPVHDRSHRTDHS